MGRSAFFLCSLISLTAVIGCGTAQQRPTAPQLLVPPPALAKCKARSFIEHRVGASESLQEIAELYLGKKNQWNEIAACNPDVDPILTTAGGNIYIPILPQKQVTITPSPKSLSVAKPMKADPPTTSVAIRGEEKRSDGDIPKPRVNVSLSEQLPPPTPPVEEFVVLPPPTRTIVAEEPPATPTVSTVESPPVVVPPQSTESAMDEGSPLNNLSQQTASTLLTCTGKECLPNGD